VSRPGSEPRRALAAAVLSVFALAGAVFFDLLFRGHVLFERDIHALFWGQCRAFVHAVSGGAWPVWNALLGFGQPMLANPGAQVLYPPTWLNLFFRPETYFTLYAIGHLTWAGLGMLALGRVLRLGWAASTTAAAFWMLSGPLLSAVDLWQHFAGAAWMPWVVAAAGHALDRPSVGRAVVWGAVQSLQVLTGSLDLVVLTAVVQLGFVVRQLEWRRPLAVVNARVLAAVAAAVAVTLSTTAALWLPALEFVGRTERAEFLQSGRMMWSVRPLVLLQCVLPIVTEDLPLRHDIRLLLGEGREPLLSSLYLGLPAFALALAALASARRRLVAGSTALVALALLLALGRHGLAYFWATAAVPPLEILRYPAKATLLAAIGLALLGAIGLEAWRAGRLGARGSLAMAVVVGILGVTALVAVSRLRVLAEGFFAPEPENPLVPGALATTLATATWSGALTLVLAGLAALTVRASPNRRARLGAAAACVAVLDLLVVNHGLNPSVRRALVEETPPVVSLLRADGARRLYVFDYIMKLKGAGSLRPPEPPALARLPRALRSLAQSQGYPASPARWGFEGSFDLDVVGLDSPQRKSLRLLAIAVEHDPDQLFRLLRLGAVDHVVALHQAGLERLELAATASPPETGPVYVYRVPGTLPRALVVATTLVADGLDAYKVLLAPTFDPHTTVLLPAGRPRAAPAGFEGRAEVLEERDDLLRVRCAASAPAWLVVPDGYDPDWRAHVDGKPAPLLRANAAFRAVPLPSGTHQVTLAYRPAGVPIGLGVSGLSILGVLAALALSRAPRRREHEGDGPPP
jgi:Bacterial membrane protein YfhO